MTLYSTPLGHQMPLAGEHIIWWEQVIWKVDPNSAWGQIIWNDDLILLLATRCQYRGSAHLRVHLIWKYELTSKFTLASQRFFLWKTNEGISEVEQIGKNLNKAREVYFELIKIQKIAWPKTGSGMEALSVSCSTCSSHKFYNFTVDFTVIWTKVLDIYIGWSTGSSLTVF